VLTELHVKRSLQVIVKDDNGQLIKDYPLLYAVARASVVGNASIFF